MPGSQPQQANPLSFPAPLPLPFRSTRPWPPNFFFLLGGWWSIALQCTAKPGENVPLTSSSQLRGAILPAFFTHSSWNPDLRLRLFVSLLACLSFRIASALRDRSSRPLFHVLTIHDCHPTATTDRHSGQRASSLNNSQTPTVHLPPTPYTNERIDSKQIVHRIKIPPVSGK
jgi:hypothetical protein